jgi:cytochrome c peroxidase
MWKIKITSVETTPENKPEIRIYPNPAEHDIQIESSEIMQQVELIDLRGQMIQRIQPESTSIQLELNNLNAGTYILRVKTKQGEIKQKFIKK